jgi:hypothetical protein
MRLESVAKVGRDARAGTRRGDEEIQGRRLPGARQLRPVLRCLRHAAVDAVHSFVATCCNKCLFGASRPLMRLRGAMETEDERSARDTNQNQGKGRPRRQSGPRAIDGSARPVLRQRCREFGSSGGHFDAAPALEALAGVAQRPSRAPATRDGFRTGRVAPSVVRVTYLCACSARTRLEAADAAKLALMLA